MANDTDKHEGGSGIDYADWFETVRQVAGVLDSEIGDTDPDLMMWDDDLEEEREMTEEEIRDNEPLVWAHQQLTRLWVASPLNKFSFSNSKISGCEPTDSTQH